MHPHSLLCSFNSVFYSSASRLEILIDELRQIHREKYSFARRRECKTKRGIFIKSILI